MANQRSVEMLAIISASQAFAYGGIAQDLLRFFPTSFMFFREYLKPVIKGDHCAHYVDDIIITAINPQQLVKNLKAVFEYIQNAGLKLTMAPWSTPSQLLCPNHRATQGCPEKLKIWNFLKKIKFPRCKKTYKDIKDS